MNIHMEAYQILILLFNSVGLVGGAAMLYGRLVKLETNQKHIMSDIAELKNSG